jgi:glycosyltransferase involved in cell wall biosynthesis
MRIFQSVKKRHNDIELIIAGGPASMIDGPLIELAGKEKNVKILGYVSNELKSDLIASAGLIILPYFNSPLTGGCRIKTLEFFSQGKVVVSTPDGIAGINGVANRKNVLMAQTFREFVDIINECLSNPASYMKIGDEAMKLAEGYTWENIATSYQNALISLSLHEIAEDKGRAS